MNGNKLELENLPSDTKVIKLPQKHNYRIPLEDIIELAEKDNSQTHIAKILGCHPSNISKRIKDIEITKKYVNHKAFMIRHLERRIYDNFTDAKLKKANLQQLGTTYGIIYDKGQLEEGGSTQIMGYADTIRAKESIKSERQKLIEEKGWIDAEFKEL